MIDTLVSGLTAEGRSEWEQFVESPRSLMDLQLWWRERGSEVGLQACETWRRNHYKMGERAKVILAMVKECQGLTGLQAVQLALCETAYNLQEVKKLLESSEEISPKLLFLHLATIKELRACGVEMENLVTRRDRMVDMLSASYEVVRKALTSAKDHPNEGWLEEVLHGAVTAMEDELKRERLGDN